MRLHTSAKQNAPVTESKPKRGLFIGANKYRDEKFREPHEDFRRSAEAMHKMLTSRGGVAPERAKLLLGEQSTRANTQQAIVYYCGHGGTVTNLEGSEPDGREC